MKPTPFSQIEKCKERQQCFSSFDYTRYVGFLHTFDTLHVCKYGINIKYYWRSSVNQVTEFYTPSLPND